MKSSKFQAPTSREIPNANHQIGPRVRCNHFARLKLGASLVLGGGCLALLFAPLAANAQSYSLGWSTIDGGGGTSTGGVYSVTGTIGQPEAGRMSGGQFTVEGGFWAVVTAVQTPGAPYLTVARSNNAVVVSWPLSATGWLLQTSTNLLLASSGWVIVPPPYQTNTINLQFIEPSPIGHKFYRLYRP